MSGTPSAKPRPRRRAGPMRPPHRQMYPAPCPSWLLEPPPAMLVPAAAPRHALCTLAFGLSLRKHAALFLDRGRDGRTVRSPVPLFAQRALDRPLLPQRCRGPSKVGIGQAEVAAFGQLNEHRIHAAGIVLDPAMPVGPVQQRRQGAVGVQGVEQPDALAPDRALLEEQKVKHEGRRANRLAPPAECLDRVIPGCGRRLAERRMRLVVIRAEHFQGEKALELHKRQNSFLLGRAAATNGRVGKGRTRQAVARPARAGSAVPCLARLRHDQRRRARRRPELGDQAPDLGRAEAERIGCRPDGGLRSCQRRQGSAPYPRAGPLPPSRHRKRPAASMAGLPSALLPCPRSRLAIRTTAEALSHDKGGVLIKKERAKA